MSLTPPLGHCYPPRSPAEVAAYDLDDLHQGYTEHHAGEDLPGENHAPGYRWGALNRERDRSGQPDGFDPIRRAAASLTASERKTHA